MWVSGEMGGGSTVSLLDETFVGAGRRDFGGRLASGGGFGDLVVRVAKFGVIVPLLCKA